MILAITNEKGGVGKTTTALNLGAGIGQRGFRTLLVDMDPQANCTLAYLDHDGSELSVFDLLTDPQVRIDDVICRTPQLNLDVIPSKLALAKIESSLIGEVDAHYRLKDALEPVVDRYRYILIDTPPTLGMLTVNALVAATHILVPIQSSYFALEGTDDLLETIQKIRHRPNPELQLLGVVITLHDRRTVLARDIKERIKEVFGEKVFRTVISKSVRLEESPAYKESIFSFAPDSKGALEYYSLTEEVLGRA